MLYLKLVKHYKTPFVFILDRHKGRGTDAQLEHVLAVAKSVSNKYSEDVFDCDDFQAVLKGKASEERFNWVSSVYGWMGKNPFKLHAWNNALLERGIVDIEPQTSELDPSYRALVVVI